MADVRATTPITGRKTVTATGTPEALVSASRCVQSVEIRAQKSQNSANTGNVYVGFSSGNGEQDVPLEPGDVWAVTMDQGQKLDLATIYIDVATNGDGVTFTAIP